MMSQHQDADARRKQHLAVAQQRLTGGNKSWKEKMVTIGVQ
ncbi:hypothetical protein [Dickeya chrysanthemi]